MAAMPILNHNLTDLNATQVQSEPGMAHFAGTGPRGKTCGHCIYWGYSKEYGREKTNKETGEKYKPMKAHEGCKKYFLVTGKHGPAIKSALLSCKYFEGK